MKNSWLPVMTDQIDQLLVDPKPIENCESRNGWMGMKQLKHDELMATRDDIDQNKCWLILSPLKTAIRSQMYLNWIKSSNVLARVRQYGEVGR